MTIDRLVLITIWAVSLIAVILFIPRRKRREAAIAFLACQAITWVNSMLHVKYGLLSFPVREFPKATELLFTTEYIMYPLMCAFYYIHEPKTGKLLRFFYLAGCITGLTVVDAMIVKHTHLIVYLKYGWYWTWIDFFVIFLITNVYCKWFFKQGALSADRRTAR